MMVGSAHVAGMGIYSGAYERGRTVSSSPGPLAPKLLIRPEMCSLLFVRSFS
uniref:Uncharacterized protein n=1 Tax=Anguilla anguilla TaxID=7936 RepID=A0A0E9SS60_ANGAN